jgi:hypothetical protein
MTSQATPDKRPINRFRNYGIFSAALAIVWAIVIILRTFMGGESTLRDTFLIFGGFAIAWVATTIARHVYPPTKRWQEYYRHRGGA